MKAHGLPSNCHSNCLEWQASGRPDCQAFHRTALARSQPWICLSLLLLQVWSVSSVLGWAMQPHHPKRISYDLQLVSCRIMFWIELENGRNRKQCLRQLQEHINFAQMCSALDKTIHHLHHPGCAFPTWCALTTWLVFVKLKWTRVSPENYQNYTFSLACENRAIAVTISVLLSMTITAPVPRPDWASFRES